MKNIFYTVFKFKDKKSPDKLGLYPERLYTKAFPERRYLWSSRMLVIIATISIAVNMILACLLIIMLPQKTSDPRILHTQPDFYNLEQTQPAEKRILATDLLAESDIVDYILLRYTISANEENDLKRWGNYSRFHLLSSNKAYISFMNSEYEYANIQRANGITRNVIVNWVKPTGVNLWQAQFSTYDYQQGKKPVINVWRAVIRISYGQRINYRNKDDVIKNPYGFLIEDFYISYVGQGK